MKDHSALIKHYTGKVYLAQDKCIFKGRGIKIVEVSLAPSITYGMSPFFVIKRVGKKLPDSYYLDWTKNIKRECATYFNTVAYFKTFEYFNKKFV